MTYPQTIPVGQEPPGFIFDNTSDIAKMYTGYHIHRYHDAVYYHIGANNVHVFCGYCKSEDFIKSVLQKSQPPRKSPKMYYVYNTLTGKDMFLYKRKDTFRNKGAAVRSFVDYMKYDEHIKDFETEDFYNLVNAGLIEIRQVA